MNFGEALELLKKGDLVARDGWNGRNMWLKLQRPDQYSLMTLPYIYLCTVQGDFVPWFASQTDLLAEDWATRV